MPRSVSPSVRAVALSFAWDGPPVFEDVSFHLTPGWTGLVGANGAGKTTLLKLLTGALRPTAGQLHLEPRGLRVRWCDQRVEARAEVERFFEASDGAAWKLRAALQLDDAVYARWHQGASPGERRRWQLAAALWEQPDVLLLDEPGNHLDTDGREVLLAALRRFRGVGVLVSHDRGLLDALTTSTLRLHHGTGAQWALPFSAARAQWQLEAEQRREQQRSLQARLQKDLARVSQRREALRETSRARSAGHRMRDAHDSDARTLAADFRAEQAEKQQAAALRRVDRHAAETRAALDAVHVDDDAGQRLFVRDEPCPRALVLHHPQLTVARGEHIWLRGRNGAGKTTLLRALLTAHTLPPERVLTLPQELSTEDTAADLETLRALPPDARGRVLQLVHALGVEPDVLLRSAAPSPGEARKLRLALGWGREVWLAVLDEPTNHLDLPSIERLEAALTAFPGALVLVTHDAALGAACTHRSLTLE